jgi:uncharacterized membrane protein
MNSTHPERPRSEPEIIPPERREPRSGVKWTSYEQRGTHRIYVTRLGPFSTIILVLAFAALLAILSLILIGTFLIWIPLAILLIALTLISGWWQRIFRR